LQTFDKVISEVGAIVPKSPTLNYINEVRDETSYDFGFGNNWFGLGTSSPFHFVHEFV
jgi:hypothetical protein